MKKKIINIITLLLLLLFSAHIAYAGTGKTGWNIFRKARSAKFRPVATTPVMAVRGDLSGIFYNPAVLGLNMAREIFFLSELGMADDTFAGAVYGHPTTYGSWGAGILYFDAGNMELNWYEDGSLKSETVKAQRDILALASIGIRYTQSLSIGLTLKAASSRLFERASASAFAADAGLIYAPPAIENLSLSVAVQNIGFSTKFLKRANPLPSSANIGAAWWQDIGDAYYITPGADLTYIIEEQRFVPELGFEAGADPLSFNIGRSFAFKEASWHFGLTWLQDSYDISYAFLPGLNLDTTHRISIGYRFGTQD